MSAPLSNVARRFSSTVSWQRSKYRHFRPVQLRWRDNNLQGQVDGSVFFNVMASFTHRFLAKHVRDDTILPQLTASDLKYKRPLSYPEPVMAGFATSDVTPTSLKIHVAFFGIETFDVTKDDNDEVQLDLDRFESEASVVGTQKVGFKRFQGKSEVMVPDVTRLVFENYNCTA